MKPQLILDMPETDYHAIYALSASGIKLLHSGPLEYWYYTYGPGRTEEQTAAMKNGSAKHKCGLEGIDEFKKAYIPALCKDHFDFVLDSQEELKQYCKENGLPVSGTKKVLADRIIDQCGLLQADAPTIWMHAQEEHKNTALANRQEILSQDEYADAINKAKQISPIIDYMRDEGGYPEVTILWEMDGMPCKARIDFLAPGIILDLKNVHNKNKSPFNDLISRTMANMMLPIQAEWYLMAVRRAAEAGVLPFDKHPLNDYVFRWLFLQSSGCPNMAIREYQETAISMGSGKEEETAVKQWASGIIDNSILRYMKYKKNFGTDKPVIPPQIYSKLMEDTDYPAWMFLRDTM